jgi:hypothetical protein
MTFVQLDSAAVAWREVEGEYVIIDLRNSEYFTVNEAAAVLWPLMGTGTSEEDLARALVDTYGISSDIADRDVAVIVADLRRRGMTVSAEGTAG